MNKERVESAQEEFERAAKHVPSTAKDHFCMGEAFYALLLKVNDAGWKEESMRLLTQTGFGGKSQYRNEVERLQRMAIEQYEKVLALDPSHVEARYFIATDHFNNKRYDAAIKEYEIALRHNPKHLNSLHLLGKSYFMKRRYDLAEQYFMKALAFYPQDDLTQYGLAMVYLHTDKGKEAYKILQHFKSTNSAYYSDLKDKISGGNREEF